MQMVLIQETSGSTLMEVGTILTETAICRLVGRKLVETGII